MLNQIAYTFILIFMIYVFVYKKTTIETMGDVYNYGAPGSKENASAEMIKIYRVNYAKRPSLTGIYTDTGPLGANIGCYDSQTQGCNCISNPSK